MIVVKLVVFIGRSSLERFQNILYLSSQANQRLVGVCCSRNLTFQFHPPSTSSNTPPISDDFNDHSDWREGRGEILDGKYQHLALTGFIYDSLPGRMCDSAAAELATPGHLRTLLLLMAAMATTIAAARETTDASAGADK